MADLRPQRSTFRYSGPVRLVDLLADSAGPGRRRFGVVYPILVSRPGFLNETTVQSAMVYPIMTMPGHPPARTGGLDGEITRIHIGRTSESDIVLDEETVSRVHAVLVRTRGDCWSLIDEGGTNGTYVDGVRVESGKPYEITGGLTTLRFGARIRLTLMYEDSFREFAASFESERNRLRTRTPPPIKLPTPAELAAAEPAPVDGPEPMRAAGPMETTQAVPLRPGAFAGDGQHVVSSPRRGSAAKTQIFMRIPAEEYQIARILDDVRSAGVAKRYRVTISGVRGEVASWNDLVACVESYPGKIDRIEALDPGAEPRVVFQRPASGVV